MRKAVIHPKKRLLILVLVLAVLLGACALPRQSVETGQAPDSRLTMDLADGWNRMAAPPHMGRAELWTLEGLPVDQLLVYPGIPDGGTVRVTAGGRLLPAEERRFRFRATMELDDVVDLFGALFSRDGSRFELVKREPAEFAGGMGIRFEFELTRRADFARLAGLGYARVEQGELFAMIYVAPRLTIFPRHRARVEQLAQTARVK